MERILRVGNQVIPEAIELLQKRYMLMRIINVDEPIGRRALAAKINSTERIVRKYTDFLNEAGLIKVNITGMELTDKGRMVLEDLNSLLEKFLKVDEISEKLCKAHNLSKVIIVPGDSDKDPGVLEELGREAAAYLAKLIEDRSVIALTGGSTLKKMVDNMDVRTINPHATVVPARGVIGSFYELQANTLVSRLAEKIGSRYSLLNIPENLSETASAALLKEKGISDTVELIKSSSYVVAGLGTAGKTALRRGNLDPETERKILEKGEGEFFGSYFDRNKKVIKTSRAIGLNIDDLKNIKEVIILSAGSSKAEAISSVDFTGFNATLITDYGAAEKMLALLQNR